MAILFGDEASLDGMIRRFLEEGGSRFGAVGNVRSISAVAERIGVAGDAMSQCCGRKGENGNVKGGKLNWELSDFLQAL
jgi:hypothetical protein